jgi:hypothetical protein
MIAVVGVAFMLENARPRTRPKKVPLQSAA